MIPLVALLAAAPGFRFGGGDDLALLRALRTKVEGPLVAVAYAERIRGFAFETDDRFWTRVERETRRRREGDVGLALQRGDYPPPAFGSSAAKAVFADFDARAFASGGKVEGETTGAFQAGQLSQVRWSKPLRFHYLYREVPLVALGQGASERTFLKAAAAALGARFVETDAYEFRLDPAEFRARIVPTVDNWRRSIQGRSLDRDAKLARITILREALASMSDDEIGRAFASPTGNSVVGHPSSALRKAVADYIDVLQGVARRPSSSKPDRMRADLLQDIDSSKPMVISVFGDFLPSVAARRRGGGTILI